jgi:Flp pilus assembly protein TadD
MQPSISLRPIAAVLVLVISTCALAADVPAPASVHQDTLAPARDAIKAERWLDAIKLLEQAAGKSPNNADVFNLLGFSHRKAGMLDESFQHYKTALALNPDHKGAHEYIGEAYLLAGDIKQAQSHLKHLERLCPKGCEERDDLQRAIAAARAKKH